MLGMSASPSLGGFLVLLRASGTPQGRRFLNTTQKDALGMPEPLGTVSSFCLGVVCGEGITSLGMLGAPLPSSLRAPPAGPLSLV